MRSIGVRALVAMRAPLQRGQVARMSDRENMSQQALKPKKAHEGAFDHQWGPVYFFFPFLLSLLISGPLKSRAQVARAGIRACSHTHMVSVITGIREP